MLQKHSNEGSIEDAIKAYEQALAIQADDVVTLTKLGESLQNFGQPQKALKCLEQALNLDPDHAVARDIRATVLMEAGRAREAVVHLEQTVDDEPGNTEAHVSLSAALMALGQADLAAELLERHLATRPDCCALYHYIAMINPKQKFVPAIEKLIGNPKRSDSDAVYCHLALGNISRSSKSFDQAFDQFLKANTLHRKSFAYDPSENSRAVDKLIRVYSKRFIRRKHQFGSASELPVFILGMPRSGSSLVEQVIASHPLVHGAGELQTMPAVTYSITQQLRYAKPYPECMSLIDRKLIDENSARYLQELELHCLTAERIVDKLPGNFLRIGLIKTLFPNARIIDCQRNPLDNCVSLFFHFFPNQTHAFELTELGQYYLDYQRLMSHWHKLFPGEIFTVQYEDLVLNQEKVSRQLIDYLGLNWDEKCLDFQNNERVVLTSSSSQVRRPIYNNSIDRWRRYEKHLQPLIEVLQQTH